MAHGPADEFVEVAGLVGFLEEVVEEVVLPLSGSRSITAVVSYVVAMRKPTLYRRNGQAFARLLCSGCGPSPELVGWRLSFCFLTLGCPERSTSEMHWLISSVQPGGQDRVRAVDLPRLQASQPDLRRH